MLSGNEPAGATEAASGFSSIVEHGKPWQYNTVRRQQQTCRRGDKHPYTCKRISRHAGKPSDIRIKAGRETDGLAGSSQTGRETSAHFDPPAPTMDRHSPTEHLTEREREREREREMVRQLRTGRARQGGGWKGRSDTDT